MHIDEVEDEHLLQRVIDLARQARKKIACYVLTKDDRLLPEHAYQRLFPKPGVRAFASRNIVLLHIEEKGTREVTGIDRESSFWSSRFAGSGVAW